MKLFQVLIVLFILTVSASVYAMGIFVNPFPLQPKLDSLKVSQELSPALTVSVPEKSFNKNRIQALMEEQRISRRLFAST